MVAQGKYSLHDEDTYIAKYFSSFYGGAAGGKFLDIGAYDPFKYCNTRILIERGYYGIYMLPFASAHARFRAAYPNPHNVLLIDRIFGHQDGRMELHEPSIVYDDRSQDVLKVDYRPVMVNVIGAQFMNMHGSNIDLLNINLHKHNLKMLDMFGADFYHRLKMLCIAHENLQFLIEAKVKPYGFKMNYINNTYAIFTK